MKKTKAELLSDIGHLRAENKRLLGALLRYSDRVDRSTDRFMRMVKLIEWYKQRLDSLDEAPEDDIGPDCEAPSPSENDREALWENYKELSDAKH